MTCTEEYKEHIEYAFHAFVRLLSATPCITPPDKTGTRSLLYLPDQVSDYLAGDHQPGNRRNKGYTARRLFRFEKGAFLGALWNTKLSDVQFLLFSVRGASRVQAGIQMFWKDL